MGIALFSSYKMYTCFWSQSPFWPEFNHVFCKVPVPVLFVVICHIPGTTISFFYFDPFCIVCFCWFSYVQSNDQHWVFTTFWAHSKALCMDYLISCLTIQFSSVAHSCPTVCDPMNRSTPGLPVHHQLPELTQTHVHQVGDTIQPSHPLSCPSPPAPNSSQHQGLFQWVNSSHEVAKVLEFQFQHHSLQRSPRDDLLQNGMLGSPCSPRDSQVSYPTPQFKSINSSVLSLLHSPTLTSIHDHKKNHSLD